MVDIGTSLRSNYVGVKQYCTSMKIIHSINVKIKAPWPFWKYLRLLKQKLSTKTYYSSILLKPVKTNSKWVNQHLCRRHWLPPFHSFRRFAAVYSHSPLYVRAYELHPLIVSVIFKQLYICNRKINTRTNGSGSKRRHHTGLCPEGARRTFFNSSYSPGMAFPTVWPNASTKV